MGEKELGRRPLEPSLVLSARASCAPCTTRCQLRFSCPPESRTAGAERPSRGKGDAALRALPWLSRHKPRAAGTLARGCRACAPCARPTAGRGSAPRGGEWEKENGMVKVVYKSGQESRGASADNNRCKAEKGKSLCGARAVFFFFCLRAFGLNGKPCRFPECKLEVLAWWKKCAVHLESRVCVCVGVQAQKYARVSACFAKCVAFPVCVAVVIIIIKPSMGWNVQISLALFLLCTWVGCSEHEMSTLSCLPRP